jgi:hypothetical protein
LPDVKLFPNPANRYINVQIVRKDLASIKLEIFDLYGRKLYSEYLFSKVSSIDITSFKDGIYIVSIELDRQRVIQKITVLNRN